MFARLADIKKASNFCQEAFGEHIERETGFIISLP